MPIPDYETLMLPLLKTLSDGQTHTFGLVVEKLAKEFSLTEEEIEELLPSGRYPVFRNRVGWARTYMVKAKLIEASARAQLKITSRGLSVIKEKIPSISSKYLEKFVEFKKFKSKSSSIGQGVVDSEEKNLPKTPQERIEVAIQEMKQALVQEVLEQIRKCSPKFFERLVVDVLVAMGYGGNFKDAARVVGQSHDGGIDGVIKEDRLGLDSIYVQAKRWEKPVSSDEIQRFIGALDTVRGKKGVFITTGKFSKPARDMVNSTGDKKIVLIDGEELSELMIELEIGVLVKDLYPVKEIKSEYFIDS